MARTIENLEVNMFFVAETELIQRRDSTIYNADNG